MQKNNFQNSKFCTHRTNFWKFKKKFWVVFWNEIIKIEILEIFSKNDKNFPNLYIKNIEKLKISELP